MLDVRSDSAPGLFGGDESGSGSGSSTQPLHGASAVHEVGGGGHRTRPELGSELGMLHHASSHLEQGAVHSLCDAVVLRRVCLCRGVLDALQNKIFLQLLHGVLSSAIGVEANDMAPALADAIETDHQGLGGVGLLRQRVHEDLAGGLVDERGGVVVATQRWHELLLLVDGLLDEDGTSKVAAHGRAWHSRAS